MKHISPVFRASYVHLNEPRKPADDAEPAYSMVMVLPKEDAETKKFLKALVADFPEVWDKKFGGELPKKLKKPVRNGDNEDHPEWEGCWVLPLANTIRPGVVDVNRKPIMEPEQLYSGAYYRVSLSPWAWTHQTGGKGISLNLDNVMWVKDGERFDNRTTAEEDFAEFFEEEEVTDFDDDNPASGAESEEEDEELDFE